MYSPPPQAPAPKPSALSRLRRFPWWVYVLVGLCLCGGVASLSNAPTGGIATPHLSTEGIQTHEALTATPIQAGIILPTDAPTPEPPKATNTSQAPTMPPAPPAPTATKGPLINVGALLAHPRAAVEAALGKPLSEAKGVTAPDTFNPAFTGTALEYKVAPYTATVYLDTASVVRGVVLDVATVFDLGSEVYSSDSREAPQGPVEYLAHLGLPMPVETPEGGNLSDRPAGDFKTLEWKHTAAGYWIYINAIRSGRIIGLHAWKLDGAATGSSQSVAVPTTQNLTARAPAGCTTGARYGAICKDGTQTSTTGQGACSKHKGVDHWLICP
jgi:hypothetical protein